MWVHVGTVCLGTPGFPLLRMRWLRGELAADPVRGSSRARARRHAGRRNRHSARSELAGELPRQHGCRGAAPRVEHARERNPQLGRGCERTTRGGPAARSGVPRARGFVSRSGMKPWAAWWSVPGRRAAAPPAELAVVSALPRAEATPPREPRAGAAALPTAAWAGRLHVLRRPVAVALRRRAARPEREGTAPRLVEAPRQALRAVYPERAQPLRARGAAA